MWEPKSCSRWLMTASESGISLGSEPIIRTHTTNFQRGNHQRHTAHEHRSDNPFFPYCESSPVRIPIQLQSIPYHTISSHQHQHQQHHQNILTCFYDNRSFMYFGSLVLTVWAAAFSTIQGFEEGDQLANMLQQQSQPLAGGWAESKLDDPMVLEAADFLFRTLLEQPSSRYSFLHATTTTKPASSPANAVVIQASQQVVAGMNFQLTLLVQSSSDQECMGAFTATVYNRFGDLSVTDWREELTCAQAKIIIERAQASNPGGED